jgi:uncharacterized protein
MTREKKMATLIIGIVLLLCAVAVGIWWFTFFSQPNPPLPRQQVTIISSSTAAVATTATTTTASSTTVASTTATTDTNIDENPLLPTEQLTIDNAAFDVEVASTMLEQSRGLSNRPSLAANDGMLFVFSSGGTQSFWMKDMNFPLDIIWISGNTVVGFAQNAPAEPNITNPFSSVVTSPPNTDKVLEVNAGTVAKYNIQVGDSVVIQ